MDYTRVDCDKETENTRRRQRDLNVKRDLQQGKPVAYKSSGWSMYPHIYSDDACQYTPVTKDSEVQKGDVVYCEVGKYFYAHYVCLQYIFS